MRRLTTLAATAALGLTLALFPAARAQAQEPTSEDDLHITVSRPGTGNHAGHVDVDATVVYDGIDSLASVTVYLANEASQAIGRLCHLTFPAEDGDVTNGSEAVRSVHVQFRWDSHRLPPTNGQGNCTNPGSVLPGGGALSPNGKYRILVAAVTYGFPTPDRSVQETQPSGLMAVSNAPAPPGGVRLSHNAGAKAITISWSGNPEPDARAYRVQECVVERSSRPCGEGDWRTVRDNWDKTSIAFGAAAPGIYRYRVAALRPNATGQTMTSGWASAQGEPTEIGVTKEAPSSSTTQPPAGPGEPPPPRVETRTVVQPTRRVARAAPQVVQRIVEEEPGYNSELPYEEGSEALGGLPTDASGDGEGQRAVLIPLAGGALLLVFAMQVHYLNRRARAGLEAVAVDGWDDV